MLLGEMTEKKETRSPSSEFTLELPPAPSSETAAVKAWAEPVVMETFLPAEPDKNPLFLEKRVYQGSSGRVYPLPVIDYIETKPKPHTWNAVHLENEFLRLMVLPQIGGRIHVGLDKRNQYDFFYRQNVIKPALVGLAGPWISGGVEFNWPQHHRPATFMPCETTIERESDGAVTVWCSDHDPMARMKGMHGLRLRPGSALLEVRVRLYNRTEQTQTFLWWANVATRVHEHYQSFFPKDVRFAADHAKRAVTEYPLSNGVYYGVDYAERDVHGVPQEDLPSNFVPDGSYAPNDLGWYANIPVPTSYMIVGSRGDFFGGYDHQRRAGTVAVSDHHIAPGKKQWTWGNHEFGYAWDRSLTESDGPYVELMSGVYTDNQPDFSFLTPGETKSFSQFWYPISDIGVPDIANTHGALHVEERDGILHVHLQVTTARPHSTVLLKINGVEVDRWEGNLSPDAALHHRFHRSGLQGEIDVSLLQQQDVLLRYAPAEIVPVEAPEQATEPPLPQDVKSNDELYLNGLHLEQYRHPTRAPEPYWQEALRRDPGDSRCHLAMGRWHLKRGEFQQAEEHLRASVKRLTQRNPNPYDGESYYILGLVLQYQGRNAEACDAFYKSTWNAAWRSAGHHRLAEIDAARKQWSSALDHIDQSLRAESENLNALNLKVILLRHLGRDHEALTVLENIAGLDPLDIFSRYLAINLVPEVGQQRLDLCFDLVRAGEWEAALKIASTPLEGSKDGSHALLLYLKADILHHLERKQDKEAALAEAAAASRDYVFPNRLEELVLLQKTIARNPNDAAAPYYLGNFLYDRRRYQEAIAMWEQSVRLDPEFPTVRRNLGFAYFNALQDSEQALAAFEAARKLAPADARILYEQDQLFKRTQQPLEQRLQRLETSPNLVRRRDDLSVELASLYNSTGEPEKALKVLLSRPFQPWEGGEGLVLGQYVRSHVLLAEKALQEGSAKLAVALLQEAKDPPRNLSEAKHLLMNLSMIDFWLGTAYSASGENELAVKYWNQAAAQKGDFQQMQVQSISDMTFWSAMSLCRLGRPEDAVALFLRIAEHASALEQQVPTIDYFATSLPAMLLFDEDLQYRQKVSARFLRAQAQIGLGDHAAGVILLQQVLEMDRSHMGAIDLNRMLPSFPHA